MCCHEWHITHLYTSSSTIISVFGAIVKCNVTNTNTNMWLAYELLDCICCAIKMRLVDGTVSHSFFHSAAQCDPNQINPHRILYNIILAVIADCSLLIANTRNSVKSWVFRRTSRLYIVFNKNVMRMSANLITMFYIRC